MKRLVLALVLFPFIFPIHAEIIIEAPAGDSGVYQCMDRLPNGIAIPKGPIHKRWLDAQVECDKARKEDPDGDYWVKAPEGLRIIISGDADAAVMIRTQGGTESAPPASGEVGWTVTVISVDENAATLALEATRTDPVGVCDLFVNTANGTASAGTDYVAIVAGTDIQYGSGLGGTDSTLVTITNRPGVIQGDLTFTATLTKDDCTSDTLVNDVITVTINDLDTDTGTFPSGWAQPPTVIDGTVLTFDQDVVYNSGTDTWDITSNDGGQIWNTADHFTAPTYLISSLGDVTFTGEVTALAPLTGSGFPLAGVMLRESLNANSTFVFASGVGPDGGQGYALATRATTGASATTPFVDGTSITLCEGFRLEVDGALESWKAYKATDCASPSYVEFANGTATWLGTGDTVYAVLAATATDDNEDGFSGVFSFADVVVDTVTSVDHSAATTVEVLPTSLNVDEDGTSFNITMQRAGGLSGASAVDTDITGGTCIAGTHYTDPGTQQLNWINGVGGTDSASITVLDIAGEQPSCTIIVTATINSGTDTLGNDTLTATRIDTDGTPPPQTGAWSTQGASGCSDGLGSFDAFIPGMRGNGSCNRGGFVNNTNVITVTNRNSSGAGSFAAAIAASCPKVILFGVAGIITSSGGSTITANCDNWSIIGSSAPGNITLYGANGSNLIMVGSNVTVGHLTVPSGSNDDGLSWGGSPTGQHDNALLYNVSTMWAPVSSTINCYHINPGLDVTNVLLWQNVLMAETGAVGLHLQNNTCQQTNSIRNIYMDSGARVPLIRTPDYFHANNVAINAVNDFARMQPCSGGILAPAENPWRSSWINNYYAEGPASAGAGNSGYIRHWTQDSLACTTAQVWEEGTAAMSNPGNNIQNCANHGCTGGLGAIMQGSAISAIHPTGYVPEAIVNTQAGHAAFVAQIGAYAGSRPTDRFTYVQDRINQSINTVDGVGTESSWTASSTVSSEGTVSVITDTPQSGYDPTAAGQNPCGVEMPTGSAANDIRTSGLTRLHEWAIGCFMDNVMSSGWREDGLEDYAAP